MDDVPTEWSLYYEEWIIGDGEPHRSVGDVFNWFTVEFSSADGLVNTTEKSKSAVALPNFEYQVCAEVIYLSEQGCVLDFGVRAGGHPSNLSASCKQGDFVSGKDRTWSSRHSVGPGRVFEKLSVAGQPDFCGSDAIFAGDLHA